MTNRQAVEESRQKHPAEPAGPGDLARHYRRIGIPAVAAAARYPSISQEAADKTANRAVRDYEEAVA